MRSPRLVAGWLGVLAGVLWAGASAWAQPTLPLAPATAAPARLPLDELPPGVRAQVRHVTEQPTLSARAPTETFGGKPSLYHWLLDHPDRACAAWQRLGTPCLEITPRGNGRFGWSDDQGSDLTWETILDTSEMRVWYAEGKCKPSLFLGVAKIFVPV